MKKYLYRFGYCTPAQWVANEAHGWDDEESSSLFVLADSEESAMEWGREVSEAYISDLFRKSGWQGDPPSWKESDFAHWIEEEPENKFSLPKLSTIPVVAYGEMPDFSNW